MTQIDINQFLSIHSFIHSLIHSFSVFIVHRKVLLRLPLLTTINDRFHAKHTNAFIFTLNSIC